MKAGLLCIAGLSAVAVAQPAVHRRHQHLHKERNIVTEIDVVTETDYATATAPNVVVYVDENGKPYSTSYCDKEQPTSAPAHYNKPSSQPAPVKVTSTAQAPAYTPPTQHSAAPVKSSPHSAAPYKPSHTSQSPPAYSSSAPVSGGSNNGYGIGYSPYKTDNGCKSYDDVKQDFAQLKGYSTIRTYGTDCDQVAKVLAAMGDNQKLFAGIYDVNNVDSEAQVIIDAVKGNWGRIDTVAVGNEGINSGSYTIPQVSSAVSQCKSKLAGAGYNGPVVTVDTFVAILSHPELCQVGDYVAANCHAFFDGGYAAKAAGTFVLGQAQAVSAACGGKKTVITESGWPSQGSHNGAAIPSEQDQADAVKSLKDSFSSNLFLFSAYNDFWKQNNAGTFGAEWYWGVHGVSASCPPP